MLVSYSYTNIYWKHIQLSQTGFPTIKACQSQDLKTGLVSTEICSWLKKLWDNWLFKKCLLGPLLAFIFRLVGILALPTQRDKMIHRKIARYSILKTKLQSVTLKASHCNLNSKKTLLIINGIKTILIFINIPYIISNSVDDITSFQPPFSSILWQAYLTCRDLFIQKILYKWSTKSAAFCALQWMSFKYPIPFYATQIINPFS